MEGKRRNQGKERRRRKKTEVTGKKTEDWTKGVGEGGGRKGDRRREIDEVQTTTKS